MDSEHTLILYTAIDTSLCLEVRIKPTLISSAVCIKCSAMKKIAISVDVLCHLIRVEIVALKTPN